MQDFRVYRADGGLDGMLWPGGVIEATSLEGALAKSLELQPLSPGETFAAVLNVENIAGGMAIIRLVQSVGFERVKCLV